VRESIFLNKEGHKLTKREIYEASKSFHATVGQLNYMLEVFGDTLAEREGYKSISGMDAIHVYLIKKHSWLPRDVTAMSPDHIRLALFEEMQGWTAPELARF